MTGAGGSLISCTTSQLGVPRLALRSRGNTWCPTGSALGLQVADRKARSPSSSSRRTSHATGTWQPSLPVGRQYPDSRSPGSILTQLISYSAQPPIRWLLSRISSIGASHLNSSGFHVTKLQELNEFISGIRSSRPWQLATGLSPVQQKNLAHARMLPS